MTTTRVTLAYPVVHNAQTIAELALRRPTVGDNLAAQKAGTSDAEREIRLIANLAEVAPEVVHLLDMKDYGKMQQVLAGFLS